jgi:hypothetical protein
MLERHNISVRENIKGTRFITKAPFCLVWFLFIWIIGVSSLLFPSSLNLGRSLKYDVNFHIRISSLHGNLHLILILIIYRKN